MYQTATICLVYIHFQMWSGMAWWEATAAYTHLRQEASGEVRA